MDPSSQLGPLLARLGLACASRSGCGEQDFACIADPGEGVIEDGAHDAELVVDCLAVLAQSGDEFAVADYGIGVARE